MTFMMALTGDWRDGNHSMTSAKYIVMGE